MQLVSIFLTAVKLPATSLKAMYFLNIAFNLIPACDECYHMHEAAVTAEKF